MEIKIIGKDLTATDAIKNYVEKKLERLVKYFGEEITAQVTIKAEKNVQTSEMHVMANGDTFRAVTEAKDLYSSIDKNIDILEGQIRKAKTKREKQNREGSIKELEVTNIQEPENEVIKTMYYEIKPMMVEDAKLKLQEAPTHNFMPFVDVETGKVCVIYKLKDGKNFGLVEPEA